MPGWANNLGTEQGAREVKSTSSSWELTGLVMELVIALAFQVNMEVPSEPFRKDL